MQAFRGSRGLHGVIILRWTTIVRPDTVAWHLVVPTSRWLGLLLCLLRWSLSELSPSSSLLLGDEPSFRILRELLRCQSVQCFYREDSFRLFCRSSSVPTDRSFLSVGDSASCDLHVDRQSGRPHIFPGRSTSLHVTSLTGGYLLLSIVHFGQI